MLTAPPIETSSSFDFAATVNPFALVFLNCHQALPTASLHRRLDYKACTDAASAPGLPLHTARRDAFIAARLSSVAVLEAEI